MIEAVAERSAELEGLCRHFHVGRLALFGSAAQGVHDPGRSDLDFSVEFQPAALDDYANTYFGLLEALETLFGGTGRTRRAHGDQEPVLPAIRRRDKPRAL